MVMDIFSIVVGVVIGVGVGIFLDVDMFAKKAADEETKIDDLVKTIQRTNKESRSDVAIFDIYQGENI